MNVESYEEFYPKRNRKPTGITQSAPMGGRMVKPVSILKSGREKGTPLLAQRMHSVVKCTQWLNFALFLNV